MKLLDAELLDVETIEGRKYAHLKSKNGEEVLVPISHREEQLQMSQIAREILSYPKLLVVSIACHKTSGKFSLGIVRLIHDDPTRVNGYRDLIVTGYVFPSRPYTVEMLEQTFRTLTANFRDECASNPRYRDDRFAILNDAIVDWIMEQIKQKDEVHVSDYF